MGQVLTCQKKSYFYDQNEMVGKSKIYFECLGLTENDISILYDSYIAVNNNGTSQISQSEIFEFLNVDDTIYNRRVFAIFDSENTGDTGISFRDFVIALWDYCTVCNSHMCEYVFDKYDIHGMYFRNTNY